MRQICVHMPTRLGRVKNNQTLLPLRDKSMRTQVTDPVSGNPFLSLPLRQHQLTHATYYAS